MNSFFKVPTDGRFTQYKLNPSQLLVACWMSNLIQLNFSQLSYSYIKVGLNTQCGIELDVRTIRSIVTSLVNKGIFTRSKKSNFYIYNIVDQNVPKNIQNDPLQNDPLNKDQNVPLGIQKDPYQVDQNVPKNIQNDPLQNDPIQNDPLQNDPLNKDQNVPLGIQKDPYQVDQNVPKNIQNDPLQNDPIQNDPLQNDPLNKDQNVPLGIQKDPYQVDQNVPKNIQNDPLQNDPIQNDPLQNDPLNKDQNVPLGIQKDPYQVDQNVPKNIQNDPSINKNNKEIEETKEEERTPVTSVIPVSAIKFDFDYQSLQDIPNLSDRAAKVYEEAYKVFPREIIRAQEVSVCVEEMSLCYELNAREFERSKPNFKDTAKERAGLIVQALLADKSKFAPIEILWGINRYKTTNTAEPTPATVKRECIKSRVENKGYNNDLQYLIRLRRDEQRICSKNANDFLCRFADRYASELEGLLNAYYAESKDYDVKFNELVLKMAEMPPIQESTPNYWNIYQNRSRELPINLDIRMIA